LHKPVPWQGSHGEGIFSFMLIPLEGEESPMTQPATQATTRTKKQHEHHNNEDQFYNKPPMTRFLSIRLADQFSH
jgi:hypothetical protein